MDNSIQYLDLEKDKPTLDSVAEYTHVEEDRYLVSLAEGGSMVYINSNTYHLLRLVDGKNTYVDISELLCAQTGVLVSPKNVYSLIHSSSISAILSGGNRQLVSTKSTIDNIKLKIILIPDKYVYILCKKLAILYNISVFPKILTLSILFNFCYAINLYLLHESKHPLGRYDLLLAYLIIMATVLLHELGHAAACVANKIKPGGIGFGFYLISPVFFADVTEAWRLDSKKRLVVDFGGIYIDMLICAFFNAYLMYCYNDFLFKIVIAKLLITLANLNPFLRFDGYWILSDFLNIQNMRKKSNECLRLLVNKLLSLRFSEKVSKRQIFLGFYSAVSWLMICSFLTFALTNHFQDIVRLPINIWIAVNSLFGVSVPFTDALVQVRKLIMPTVFYYFLFTLITPYGQKISQFFSTTKS